MLSGHTLKYPATGLQYTITKQIQNIGESVSTIHISDVHFQPFQFYQHDSMYGHDIKEIESELEIVFVKQYASSPTLGHKA